jgi:xanthine dehydrogenase accessory factor
MRNIYLQIAGNLNDINNLVLATVTGTEGSTPQKPGSSALFNRGGLVAGTVGGGVLEGKVQILAKETIDSGIPGIHFFSLDNSILGGEDALCGGKISVLIDPVLQKNIDAFKALTKSGEARIPGILITLITTCKNNETSINRYWMTEGDKDLFPGELWPYVEPEFRNLLSGTDSYDFREIKLPDLKEEHSRILFLEPVIPQPRLIIAGAGHIGKALSQIGSMLDFEITVIDDRAEFANRGNIPLANHIIIDDIGKAIGTIQKGKDTYIVIVTRGHKDDRDALKACIRSGAAYIGMIGSKNKVELMRGEFIGNGWASEEQWNKIFAPVGIDIKSKTVEEIAVSIGAQLVKVKNERTRREL